MKRQCDNILDTDDNEHDVTCCEPAIFLCDGKPRCHQCAHDWLDDEADGLHQLVFIGIRADPPAATDTGPQGAPPFCVCVSPEKCERCEPSACEVGLQP